MTAKKKSLLNKAHILGPAGPPSAGPSRILARPPQVRLHEHIRPSQCCPERGIVYT